MPDLPNYLLEQLFLPGGRRLPKRKSYLESLPPAPKYMGFSSQYDDRRLPAIYKDHKDARPVPTIPADFKFHEFQFWRGYRSDGERLWQCRACYGAISDAAHRRTHHEGTGCAKRVVAGLKHMRKEKICAGCGASTHK